MISDLQNFIYNHATLLFMSIAMSPLWNILEINSNNFFTSTATSLVITLWFLDMLSRWVAKFMSPTEKISIRGSFKGLLDLLVWLIVMAVAYCFRIYGAFWAAFPIESASVLILGASVLKNISASSANPLLKKVGDQFSREIEHRVEAMTTIVTVAPNAPPNPPTITVVTEPVIIKEVAPAPVVVVVEPTQELK